MAALRPADRKRDVPDKRQEENESRTEGMMGKRSDRCCTLSQQMVELEEEKGKVGRDGDKDAERRKAEYSARERTEDAD